MPKKISDMAIEKAPSLPDRISLFQSKLAIASYAQGSITDYCHALYKAVVHLGKLPDDFTQRRMLTGTSRRCSLAFFPFRVVL